MPAESVDRAGGEWGPAGGWVFGDRAFGARWQQWGVGGGPGAQLAARGDRLGSRKEGGSCWVDAFDFEGEGVVEVEWLAGGAGGRLGYRDRARGVGDLDGAIGRSHGDIATRRGREAGVGCFDCRT